MSDVYEFEIPQLIVTSSVNLENANGKGSIVLDWSGYDISDKYFVIYKKQESLQEWDKIVSLDDRFNGNSYVDVIGNDNNSPVINNINIFGSVGTNGIQIDVDSTDLGTKYSYYVEAYDSKSLELLNVNEMDVF